MKLYSMHNVTKLLPKKYDAFFCADGLEGRDIRGVSLCIQQQFLVKKWIVFQYAERSSEKVLGESELNKFLKERNVIHIHTSYMKTRNYYELLSEILGEIGEYQSIGIDITGFKNQFFFPLLKLLSRKCTVENIDVYYTEPATYKFPQKKESTHYFPNMKDEPKVFFNYSKADAGIEVKSIPGFEGERAKDTVLVIILGFDGKVAIRIKEEYSAHKVILINGFPAYLPKFRDISLLNNKELVKACSKDEIYNTYADNPFEVYNVLYRIKEMYKEDKLVIAPLGAKPLALGVCKFVIDNPQNAVLYVQSIKYVEKSTEDYGETWIYELDLGDAR